MSYTSIGGYKRSGLGVGYSPESLRKAHHENSIFYPMEC